MERINKLFVRYMDNECTVKEINELLAHFEIPEDKEKLEKLIQAELNRDVESDSFSKEEDDELDSKLSAIYGHIKENIHAEEQPKKIIAFTPWLKVAAGIIVILGIGLAVLFHKTGGKQPEANNIVVHEIKAGGNIAALVLSNGSQIELNAVKNGIIAHQGSAEVSKTTEGKLTYVNQIAKNGLPTAYNKVIVPYGGQYKIVLTDGTKVWLNAGSTLNYPTSFNGKTRNVTLTGEAYFEVAKNKNQPFIVKINETAVQVLGTHFNIMAYDNEPGIDATLLEGSIKVSEGKSNAMVKPGQQAVIHNDIHVIKADTSAATAWKNGDFLFVDADIKNVMHKIERWYNVKTLYSGAVPTEHVNGKIPRNTDIHKLLTMLSITGGVHFKIDQDTITVSR